MNCKLCKSEYRREIEFLMSQKIPLTQIARKYAEKFNSNPSAFLQVLQRHAKGKHPPLLADTLPDAPIQGDTFDDYARRLLKVGFDPEMMSPKRVSHSAIIAAKRAQLEERKVNGALDAQKLAFLKFFRGSVTPIEGEIVDGNESDGVKNIPSNTD